MQDERYLLRLIEDIISKKIPETSQASPYVMLKADNGEFFDLDTKENKINVKRAIISWITAEHTIEIEKAVHSPPDAAPPAPAPPTTPVLG